MREKVVQKLSKNGCQNIISPFFYVILLLSYKKKFKSGGKIEFKMSTPHSMSNIEKLNKGNTIVVQT
jgi:hypothetical protein